jgi:hypothetical protein
MINTALTCTRIRKAKISLEEIITEIKSITQCKCAEDILAYRPVAKLLLYKQQPLLGNANNIHTRFEAFTAVTMKKAVFWDLAPCICGVNRRFGGTYRHLQG